ncbi:MAG: hypothetical protein Q4F99_06200, partial [bacterium]|nr:hypothetical protein [bacterium]
NCFMTGEKYEAHCVFGMSLLNSGVKRPVRCETRVDKNSEQSLCSERLNYGSKTICDGCRTNGCWMWMGE